MTRKNIISISEARKNIFKIAEEAQKPDNHYILTEKGRAKVVLMSAEEFESWQETMEAMWEFPNLRKDIEETGEAFKSGDYKKWSTLDQLLAKEGFLVADKSSKKYGVSSKHQAKRGKRIKKIA